MLWAAPGPAACTSPELRRRSRSWRRAAVEVPLELREAVPKHQATRGATQVLFQPRLCLCLLCGTKGAVASLKGGDQGVKCDEERWLEGVVVLLVLHARRPEVLRDHVHVQLQQRGIAVNSVPPCEVRVPCGKPLQNPSNVGRQATEHRKVLGLQLPDTRDAPPRHHQQMHAAFGVPVKECGKLLRRVGKVLSHPGISSVKSRKCGLQHCGEVPPQLQRPCRRTKLLQGIALAEGTIQLLRLHGSASAGRRAASTGRC
mmetsp:Transcript_5637/g.17354  ORF Transcript_5637/g.17354 Transcript_5637/m.17354 type:complete len:258 (+) Transcript_5637:238-1011(+)